MVDQVVTGEGVDLVGVAGDASDGDRDQLAVACGLREGGGPVEQLAGKRREHGGGHHGGHVVTGLGPLDDLGDGGLTAHGQLVDDVLGFGGHGCSVGGTPDTALSREVAAYPEVVIAVSVLGPVELHRDGERIAVRAGKTTEVLVRLALEAGVMVRTERLIEDLWADEAVGTARNVLQTKVSRLRRALGDAALVTGTSAGYTLQIAPSAVDALEVLRLAELASALRHAGDPSAVLQTCTTALAMFQGEILVAAGDGDWVIPHRVRLGEVRLGLVEDQLAARLDLGAAGEVIGELEALVSDAPSREGLWALLMVALYRDGRQADALATYQRARSWLAGELGLDPGLQLQQLQQQILAHDPSLGVPSSSVRGLGPERPAGNLPSIAVELVGRETEVAAIADLLASSRLVEIVGPGGVGKTVVAIATGRRLSSADGLAADGVWLARLETAQTADDVVDALVAALNVGSEAALFERLKGSTALVILDNCEHVVDAAAALAGRLLDAAPGLRILCTSQVPLDIDGEVVFDLVPLALSDAVALFTRRASAQRTNRASTEPDDAVHELCRSLDGLPLAIELAAARTKTLSIEEITRRLDDRFTVLSDPASRRPERRRALRSTIRWSYDLLFPDDQRGLWALATFAGGAPLPAVESVLEALDVPAAAAIDVVGRLANRSLVIVDDEDAPMTVRYRLLDSIRAYALEAMADAGLSGRAVAAHAGWFADAAGSSTQGVRSSRQAEHLAFARAERANIDTALAWSIVGDPLVAFRLVNGFGWAWVVLGDSRGAQRILTALDAIGEAAPVGDRANALLLAAWIEASTGRLELARKHIVAATVLADTIDDVDLQARCCYYLAYVVSHDGEFRQAMELTDRSDALYTGLDRPWDQAANWLFAARAAISADDEERSVDAVDHVQHWLRTVDDPWLHVRCDAALGELARIQHRFDDAVVHLGRAAETSRRLGFRQTEAYQLSSLGRAQCQAGDYLAGAATLGLAIDKAEATGDVRLAALARVHLGRILRALGQDARARVVLEAAAAWHRTAGGGEQAALGECLLAAMDAADRELGAEERLVAILDDARRNDDAHVEVFALDALARIAADAGDMAAARDFCAAADRRMEAASHFITELDRTDAHSVRQIAWV
jgi:predicted ATPase/DNA-binding SARP family transcriptional activator